ncbi:MAG: hypothetical protein JST79_08485 [Acidobacteria bacterium]|nr:hypothetical protein [Acidobacteriota bacterium]
MRSCAYCVIVLSLVLSSGPCSVAQDQPPPPSPQFGQLQIPQPGGPPDESKDPNRARLEREMAKRANKERQEKLKRDTDQLLKLATELKEYVDKTNENMLSLEVVKKAEEIEKLARSVKDKMKGP